MPPAWFMGDMVLLVTFTIVAAFLAMRDAALVRIITKLAEKTLGIKMDEP